jgi:hypothetical protein
MQLFNFFYTSLYELGVGYLFVFIERTTNLIQAHGSNNVNCLSFTFQQPKHNSPTSFLTLLFIEIICIFVESTI